MKVTYFVSTGTADPTRASIPLHLALNGSLENGDQVSLVFGGDAAEILLGDNAQSIEGVGVPPMRELVAKMKEHSIPVYV